MLAPTVNMHRSTLNGRNFECYSEDPFLAGEVAVAYITGLQARGVGATVKHFIGNKSEYQRTTISSDIDERTLREIYMPPFEAAVKRAGTWALMTSYNRLNGTFVSERAEIVNGVLKSEWGFEGVVMSDWAATHTTAEALNAGLDLEMPGPGVHRREKLIAAFQSGVVRAPAIREAARRILRLIDRAGEFDNPDAPAERAEDLPSTRALIRRAGAEGVVLLKNNAALPLVVRSGGTLAVIGPNAKVARAMGGGSARLNPHYLVSPFEALRGALPADVTLAYELGADNRRLAAVMKGKVAADFYDGTDFSGPIRRSDASDEGLFMFIGGDGRGVDVANFSARVRTTQTPDVTGDHEFSLVSTGPSRLYVDGELVVDNWDFALGLEFFATASDEAIGTRHLEVGRTYEVTVEWCSPADLGGLGLTVLRMGMSPVLGADALQGAVALAKTADVALLVLNGEWDTEGMDQPAEPRSARPSRRTDPPRRRGEPQHNRRVAERRPGVDALAERSRRCHRGLVSGPGGRQRHRGRAARQGQPGGRLPDVPAPPRRRPDAHQLSRRSGPCPLWRRDLCRLPLRRETQDRASVPFRLRAQLHALRGEVAQSRQG